MLTIAEIARRYDLPESTARYYCKRFRPFLPHVGEGKRRRFLPEALPVFETLLEAMNQSKSASSVEHVLRQKFPETPRKTAAHNGLVADQRGVTSQTGQIGQIGEHLEALLQQQNNALQGIAESLQQLCAAENAPQKETNGQLETRLQNMEARIENLGQEMRRELKNLSSMQDQAERIHQQDMEQLRKWLNHLAREQAKERESSQ